MTTTGERAADVARLRSALSGVAGGSGTGGVPLRGGSSTRRGAGAAPRGVNEPECRSTRASIHDYLSGRLLPHRRRRLEAHLDRCAECTRAFIDVREVTWTRLGPDRRPVTAEHEGGRLRRKRRTHVSTATG